LCRRPVVGRQRIGSTLGSSNSITAWWAFQTVAPNNARPDRGASVWAHGRPVVAVARRAMSFPVHHLRRQEAGRYFPDWIVKEHSPQARRHRSGPGRVTAIVTRRPTATRLAVDWPSTAPRENPGENVQRTIDGILNGCSFLTVDPVVAGSSPVALAQK
jgi:hypothetical protein